DAGERSSGRVSSRLHRFDPAGVGRAEPRAGGGGSARRRPRAVVLRLRRVAIAALAAGAGLVPVAPAAAGRGTAGIDLDLVPLQTAQLGPARASFALTLDSGEIENWQARLSLLPSNGYLITGGETDFGRFGRIDGYALDYGDEFTGSTGVMEIRSGVEEYENPADARKGLNAWRKEDARAANRYST